MNKHTIHRALRSACLRAACIVLPALLPALQAKAAPPCPAESYAAPDDLSATYPLTKPSIEFTAMQNAARQGDVQQQRNLAISYEAGYLVKQCEDKAAYWYGRAAQGGDETAKAWVAQRERLEQLATGPQCLGASCGGDASAPAQAMTLFADPYGHFHSTIAINGVEVEGVIDTGASMLSMSTATAAKLGISLTEGMNGLSQTANGKILVKVQHVPNLRFGNFTLTDVPVSVSATDTPTLIGMSVLRRLKIDTSDGRMVLSR